MAPGTRTINFLVELNRRINTDLGYSLRMEHGVQTPDFTLRTGVGSCRDFAWLLVSILRQMGLAARFVSGYLVQLASDVKALDGPSGPAADFTDLHAWAEVYIPGAGWIGLDPTSGLFAGEGHIPLAATPSPASAAPITGNTDPCESVLEFSNTVTRIHEDPRVTLPYTDEAWATIQDVARGVDKRLTAGDVRLTVGGEPTFVSVDNQVDDEWITAADGPHKRQRASDLAARLKAQWAPQGLIHRGQGRWYPGEPLPRWQIGLYWRTDGQPLWPDDTLLADPWGTDPAGPPADSTTAHELLAAIADGLGLPLSQVRPAYEDPLSRLAAKARLPEGDPVSPDADLDPEAGSDTAAGRAELLARLDESTTTPAAFVLPLHRRDDDLGWASADWRLRRGRDRAGGRRLAGRFAAAAGCDQLEAAAADRSTPTRPPSATSCTHRPPKRSSRTRRLRDRADHSDGRRGSRRAALRLHAAHRGAGTLRRPDRAGSTHAAAKNRLPGRDRRLRTTAGPAADVDDDHPRPRGDRSQHRAHRQFRRAEPATGNPLRASQIGPPVYRVIRSRRQPRRHRRR